MQEPNDSPRRTQSVRPERVEGRSPQPRIRGRLTAEPGDSPRRTQAVRPEPVEGRRPQPRISGRHAAEPDDSPRHWCYGCGDRNPEGLQIAFEVDGTRVSGRFQPRETHRGWPGFAHGGVAAAALDEAMGWATWASGALAMTARMEVKYRRPLPLDEELIVSAEVTRDRGRRLEAEASIRTQSGEMLAQASGVFIRVPAERAQELDALFFGDRQAGDLEKDDVPSRSS